MSPISFRRIILAVYPAEFRTRYGNELAAVVEDCGGGWRVTSDLAVSAAKERLNPAFVTSQPEGRRLRLQTTTTTVVTLWAWSVLAVAVFAREVDDHPGPGLRSWGWGAYAAGNVIFELSAAAILAAGFAYWLRVVIPAVRTKNKRTLVPAALPVAMVLFWLACTGLLAMATHHIQSGNYRYISAQSPHSFGGWALLAAYAIFTMTCVAVGTAAVQLALKNAKLPAQMLTGSSLAAAAAAISLAAVTICAAICLSWVLMIGGISLREEATAIATLSFLVLTTVSAAVSSTRGLMAFRTATAP